MGKTPLLPLGIAIVLGLLALACGDGERQAVPETPSPGTTSSPERAVEGASPSPSASDVDKAFAGEDIPPIADDKTVSTARNTLVNFTLTAADADSTCGSPGIDVVSLPANGTVYLAPPVGCANANPDGPASESPPATISLLSLYVPDSSFCGTDSFTYAAVNDGDFSAEATVTITVACLP